MLLVIIADKKLFSCL